MPHFLHLLTLIFVACKLGEIGVVAHWSWWLVFAPSILAVCLGFFMFLIFMSLTLLAVWIEEKHSRRL